MKRPQTDEFAVGYEQQLGEYAFGAQLVLTDTTDLIGWQIQGDGEYEDMPYVNPLTGETIMLKNLVTQPTLRKANDPGAAANVPPGTKFGQDYTGVFLTFRKRHTGPLVSRLVARLVGVEGSAASAAPAERERCLLHQLGRQGSQPSFVPGRPLTGRPAVGVQGSGNGRPALAAQGGRRRQL